MFSSFSPLKKERDPGLSLSQHPKGVQQKCQLAAMEAQLSKLQKMFCKISDAMNLSKEKADRYAGGSFFSDSKGPTRNISKSHIDKNTSKLFYLITL